MPQRTPNRRGVMQRIVQTPARTVLVLVLCGLVLATTLVSTVDGTASNSHDAATPNVVVPTGSPVPCGVPATSWGPATASDVQIHIVSVEHDAPTAATPTSAAIDHLTLVEMEIANLGEADVGIERNDVTIWTCNGRKVHPMPRAYDAEALLGAFHGGEARSGTLAFAIPEGDQAQRIVVTIQELNRTGAHVECDLVVALANSTGGHDVGVGCSAFGGNGVSSADANGAGAAGTAEAGT